MNQSQFWQNLGENIAADLVGHVLPVAVQVGEEVGLIFLSALLSKKLGVPVSLTNSATLPASPSAAPNLLK